jgi:hypothetical protein
MEDDCNGEANSNWQLAKPFNRKGRQERNEKRLGAANLANDRESLGVFG